MDGTAGLPVAVRFGCPLLIRSVFWGVHFLENGHRVWCIRIPYHSLLSGVFSVHSFEVSVSLVVHFTIMGIALWVCWAGTEINQSAADTTLPISSY
jgi:hypothetical protein